MRYRALGKSDLQASVVGLGTWVDESWNQGSPEEQNLIDAIKAAIDSGINLIDTAPIYGLGFSEELVAKAIAGNRDKVLLTTKCGLVWNTNKGKHLFEEKGIPVNRYLGDESIRFELDESLRRLKTDYIDLYQIHVFEPDRPVEEAMLTLLDLKAQGKIRAIGACNLGIRQLEGLHKSGQLDAIQQQYSLLDRRAELDILPYCYNHNIAVLAYSPLLQGLLSGFFEHEQRFSSEALQGGTSRINPESLRVVTEVLKEFEDLALRYGLTLPQMAIAWTFQSPGITHVLAGALNIAQAQKIAAASDASLTEDDIFKISGTIESSLIQAGSSSGGNFPVNLKGGGTSSWH